MRVLVISNPVSGQGRARLHGEALAEMLGRRGHDPHCLCSTPAGARQWLQPHLAGAEAIAVVGGDGTVRSVARVIAESGVPLVHVPQGNENLFARSLHMGPHLEDTVRLLETGVRHEVDVAMAGGHAMMLMASIGLDAEVVADVAARRGDRVSDWDYLRACARVLPGWSPPRVSVHVDGAEVVPAQRGWVVISHAALYGGGFNPAPMARMDDGMLDLAFFRASGAVEMITWLLRCRSGRHLGAAGFVHRRIRTSATVRLEAAARWQLDGDPPPGGGRVDALEVTLGPARLTTLVPGAGG